MMGNSSATLRNVEEIYLPGLTPSTGARTGNAKERTRRSKGDLVPLNYETVSDETLVELYKNKRDEVALSNIIRRYKDTMFGFAMRMTKNHSDAEDIVQEISLTLVKKLDTFKGNSKFSTWLYKVTLNTCYMVLNKTKKTKTHEVDAGYVYESAQGSSAKWEKDPAHITLYREGAQVIEDAVNELSEHNREIIRLKYLEGYSNALVSNMTGISVCAIKSRLLRSRLVLRKRLRGYFRDNR